MTYQKRFERRKRKLLAMFVVFLLAMSGLAIADTFRPSRAVSLAAVIGVALGFVWMGLYTYLFRCPNCRTALGGSNRDGVILSFPRYCICCGFDFAQEVGDRR